MTPERTLNMAKCTTMRVRIHSDYVQNSGKTAASGYGIVVDARGFGDNGINYLKCFAT